MREVGRIDGAPACVHRSRARWRDLDLEVAALISDKVIPVES